MTLLIPLSYLNEACFLSINTDEKKYKMSLRLAQSTLKEILGPQFYAQIESQYPNSLSAANATLYEDYIKDYLAWQTYFNHLKFSQSSVTPTGARQFKDENSDILSDIKLSSLEKNVGQQAEHYKNEMINYLKLEQEKDSTAFPLYTQRCFESFSFGFTGINGQSDSSFRVNRATTKNE